MEPKSTDLSIVLTAHREGLIAHKTVKSIERACAKLDQANISYEILVSIDRGDEITISYFHRYQNNPKFRIFEWDFGDLAKSRNATIKQAHGKYIATIDADDLMSENWLVEAVQTLEAKLYGKYIAHSAMTVGFDESTGQVDVVQKYAHTNKDQDLLLSVWSGRWNSVIVAPKKFFEQHKYPPNSPGFGYEDWHLSIDFINEGLVNVLIPETVIFVRVKSEGSEWQRQKRSRSVLHAHPVFKPSNFKKIQLKNIDSLANLSEDNYKNRIKQILKNHPKLTKAAQKSLFLAKRVKSKIQPIPDEDSWQTPTWLEREWRAIHQIEKKLFPPIKIDKIYHTITDDHYQTGLAYWQICQLLDQDSYDYALFVPWLMAGGADLFALNYADYLTKLGQKVVVIATNETDQTSTWARQLNQRIPFVNFGQITTNLSQDQKYRLLEQLIENLEIKTLHILNSALAYDFVRDHKIYLQGTGKKIIATAYSQSTDESGRVFGFSHTHLPEIYHQLDLITTDNQLNRQNWIDEYAFDPEKIVVHHQPFEVDKFPKLAKTKPSYRILWASRLAPEKLPNLVVEISELLGDKFTIEMYGHDSKELPERDLKTSSKVHYLGGFKDVCELPIENYDLFLYTSLFDGMPNLPIEIALIGLPIVAANVGGLAEFIGENGLLVENNTSAAAYVEQIQAVYDNYDSALNKAQKLQKQAQKQFSPDNFTAEIKQLIELINPKP